MFLISPDFRFSDFPILGVLHLQLINTQFAMSSFPRIAFLLPTCSMQSTEEPEEAASSSISSSGERMLEEPGAATLATLANEVRFQFEFSDF